MRGGGTGRNVDEMRGWGMVGGVTVRKWRKSRFITVVVAFAGFPETLNPRWTWGGRAAPLRAPGLRLARELNGSKSMARTH